VGSSAIVESFSYDAVGNRTSMSDSSGGTTYLYNQLSQLTSETRTFAGLAGTYTLSYDYHVGGQLKSITDHTNQRINYTYDNAGRLNALTGTNYTYGQFINSIAYRASGQPRQTTYGNGRVESVTYNARLSASHYEVPAGGGFGAAIAIDYQYYDDGRLKYSHDLLDNRFDRSYEYDHLGRLTKALTGTEARGESATTDRPYNETATYDAFNHLNVRSSKHWSRALGFGSSDSYANNRRVGWTYDSEGEWLSGGGRQHTYDAAGRTSTTTWTGGYFNEFSDGDGWRVKTIEPNLVTYFLRSTVLGGEVVEELSSSGAKQKSFIYYGHKVIGYDWANGNVSMVHEDPSGVTIRSSIPQSAVVTYFSELDPWKAEVFAWDPYLEDPGFSGGRGESGPIYPAFGDISMPSTGCTIDGSYMPCDMANRALESDSAVVGPENTTRYWGEPLC
jgi:YD repeat-containing protein